MLLAIFHSSLVHLLTAFDGSLDVNQLIIPEPLPKSKQVISITPAALTNIAFSYYGGDAGPSTVNTNLTDYGGTPLGLLLLFTGFETNSGTGPNLSIQVISYAPSSSQNPITPGVWSMSNHPNNARASLAPGNRTE